MDDERRNNKLPTRQLSEPFRAESFPTSIESRPTIAGNNSNFHQQRIQSAETNVRVVWQKLKRIKRKTRENFGRYSRPNWHLRSDRRGGSAVEVNWGLDGRAVGGGVLAGFFEGLARVRKQKGGRKKERKGGKGEKKKIEEKKRKVEAHYRWACVSKPPKADLKESKKEATLACLIAICKYWECFPALQRIPGRARARSFTTLPTNCDYLTEIPPGGSIVSLV